MYQAVYQAVYSSVDQAVYSSVDQAGRVVTGRVVHTRVPPPTLSVLPYPGYTLYTARSTLYLCTSAGCGAPLGKNVLGSKTSGSLGRPLLKGSLGQSCPASSRVLPGVNRARWRRSG